MGHITGEWAHFSSLSPQRRRRLLLIDSPHPLLLSTSQTYTDLRSSAGGWIPAPDEQLTAVRWKLVPSVRDQQKTSVLFVPPPTQHAYINQVHLSHVWSNKEITGYCKQIEDIAPLILMFQGYVRMAQWGRAVERQPEGPQLHAKHSTFPITLVRAPQQQHTCLHPESMHTLPVSGHSCFLTFPAAAGWKKEAAV